MFSLAQKITTPGKNSALANNSEHIQSSGDSVLQSTQQNSIVHISE